MSNPGLLNPFGNGGRTDNSAYYKNLDKNLALSASDMGKTISISTSNGYGVVLPDARQLNKTTTVTILNISDLPISVYNNNKFILAVIPGRQCLICWCTNKTTSSGIWTTQIVGSSLLNSIGVSDITNLWFAVIAATCSCQISSNRMLLSTYAYSSIYAIVFQLNSDNTIQMIGSAAASLPLPAYNDLTICRNVIDDTAVIIVQSRDALPNVIHSSYVTVSNIAAVTMSAWTQIFNTNVYEGSNYHYPYQDLCVVSNDTNRFVLGIVMSYWSNGLSSWVCFIIGISFYWNGSSMVRSNYWTISQTSQWPRATSMILINSVSVAIITNTEMGWGITKISAPTNTFESITLSSLIQLSGLSSAILVSPDILLVVQSYGIEPKLLSVSSNSTLSFISTTIVPATFNSINSDVMTPANIVKMSDSRYLVTYLQQNNDSKPVYLQISISGTTLTQSNRIASTDVLISSGFTLAVGKLSPTVAFHLIRDSNTSYLRYKAILVN